MKVLSLKLIILCYAISCLIPRDGDAQDLLAGEITTSFVTGFTYNATITIYAKDTAINRDSAIISWGDGINDTLAKASEAKINDLRMITYNGTHVYPGDGIYSISYTGSYRISGIENIPSSDTKVLLLGHTLRIFSLYNNSSVQFLSPPYDIGVAGEVYNYWPGAYDPDGDSLSYSIDTPSGSGAYIPAGISIDEITGVITWDSPLQVGDYALKLTATEWRDSIVIATTEREMFISIGSFTGNPVLISVSLKVEIYPNPTTGQITITNLPKETTRITVYNVLGELVYDQLLTDPQINISEFPKGVYFLIVNSNGKIQTNKIIKI